MIQSFFQRLLLACVAFSLLACAPSFDTLFRQATRLHAEQRLTEARTLYRILLERFPHHPQRHEVLFRFAGLLETQGASFGEHERVLRELVQDHGTLELSFESVRQLANLYHQQERTDQAITLLTSIRDSLQETSQAALLTLEIVRYHELLGDERQALLELELFLEDFKGNPGLPEILMALGDLHLKNKDYEEAQKYYQQIVTEFPQHYLQLSAKTQEALCWQELGRWARALEIYQSRAE